MAAPCPENEGNGERQHKCQPGPKSLKGLKAHELTAKGTFVTACAFYISSIVTDNGGSRVGFQGCFRAYRSGDKHTTWLRKENNI